MVVTKGKSGEGVVKSKGGQQYGNRRKYDFEWAHNAVNKWCIIEQHSRSLYILTNVSPINLFLKNHNEVSPHTC